MAAAEAIRKFRDINKFKKAEREYKHEREGFPVFVCASAGIVLAMLGFLLIFSR